MSDSIQAGSSDGDTETGVRPAECGSGINEEDIFYWMDDEGGADVPLGALGVELPLGCRFCC